MMDNLEKDWLTTPSLPPIGPGDKPINRKSWWNSDNQEHLWFIGPGDRFIPLDRLLESGLLRENVGPREKVFLCGFAEAILRQLQ